MKKETYEAQKAFAGEKKPSMLRRCVGHDYTGRQIYMITMVTEGRRALFGHVVGKSDAPEGSPDEPHIELSALGKRVADEWWAASLHHPEVEVIALQMMPDHLHGILFVREKMEKPLGMALRGFKQSCNKHYRELVLGLPPVPSVALATQQTQPAPRNLTIAGVSFSAIGNCFLLNRPVRLFVQCSRHLTEAEIQAKVKEYLTAARQGAVLVSPAISPGEKSVMRAAFNEGLPLIYLQENGLTDLVKPSGARMEACARGQLLILSPWEHHNEQITISRNQCLMLNDLARQICEND